MFLLANWGYLDGKRAYDGTPSLLTLSPRRALNLAYFVATRYMDDKERKAFDSRLSKSMLDCFLDAAVERAQAKVRRLEMVKQLGEIA